MKIKYWIPAVFWMALIFYFSSLPKVTDPFGFDPFGYWKHVAIYLVLGLFLVFGLNKSNISSRKKLILFTLVIGFVYGLSDEFHQSLVPGRFADIFDVVFDVIGSFIGAIIYTAINKIRKQ